MNYTPNDTINLLLPSLSEAFAPTGLENDAADIIKNFVTKYADEVMSDRLGSVVALYRRTAPSVPDAPQKIMLCTHMDEACFMVQSITDDGFLKVSSATLKNDRAISSRAVIVGDERGCVDGFVPADPIHLGGASKTNGFYVDVGAHDADDAKKRISIGAMGTFRSNLVRFGENGRRLNGKALYGRTGCAILCALLKKMRDDVISLPFDLYFSFSARGLSDSGKLPPSTANIIKPDIAIMIGAAKEDCANGLCGKDIALGRGVFIPYSDGRVIYDRRLCEMAIETATKSNIPHTVVGECSGVTSLASIMRAAGGVRSCAMMFSARYTETASCVIDEGDIVAVLNLTKELTEALATNKR